MPDRTIVTFQTTAFNATESREYFINPGNYGDDLARWLMDALRARAIEAPGEPGQEDHGWYFTFVAGGVEHDFVVGNRDDSDGEWIGWIERRTGLIASLLGRRKHGIRSEAVQALHEALVGSDTIRNVRWHTRPDIDAGNEDAGRGNPFED